MGTQEIEDFFRKQFEALYPHKKGVNLANELVTMDHVLRWTNYLVNGLLHSNTEKPATPWIPYDWNKIESRPKNYGKYFVHRKDGKVHWETWNGSGWAYNGNVITHYMELPPPPKQK